MAKIRDEMYHENESAKIFALRVAWSELLGVKRLQFLECRNLLSPPPPTCQNGASKRKQCLFPAFGWWRWYKKAALASPSLSRRGESKEKYSTLFTPNNSIGAVRRVKSFANSFMGRNWPQVLLIKDNNIFTSL
jgi:hypothetical protein